MLQFSEPRKPRGGFVDETISASAFVRFGHRLCRNIADAGAQRHAANFPSGTIIDLSYPFDSETVYWPTAELFHLEKDFDFLITESDFKNWEQLNGKMAAGTIVLLRTGFGRFYPNLKRYLGTDQRGAAAVADLHFPGLHPDAARWLTQNRRIKAIGLDNASIDYGQSTLFESHRRLYASNVPALENVANLDKLPITGFSVIALPMKIKGGSGGPLRIVAIVPERK